MWEGIELFRTGRQHGTDEIGAVRWPPSPGSSSALRTSLPSIPLTATTGCPEVENLLTQHRPQATVVNADATRSVTGDPITRSERHCQGLQPRILDGQCCCSYGGGLPNASYLVRNRKASSIVRISYERS